MNRTWLPLGWLFHQKACLLGEKASQPAIRSSTSREILRCSLGIVSGVSFDDLDDDSDTLHGYRSEFTGPAPVVFGAARLTFEQLSAKA